MTSAGSRHSTLFLSVAGTFAVLFFVLFVVLGTWQLKRRVWKLDLIARVEQRVHAPPVAAPGPYRWPQVSAATDEYRHVTAVGTYLDESQTLVQALTDLGSGYWVLTPLRAADGSIVLVNRGFVAADDGARIQQGATAGADSNALGASAGVAADATATSATTAAPGTTHVTGLLRITEPGGAFLRHNDPSTNHWYSRDVQAIARARRLTHVAPYFIDAEATSRAYADATPEAYAPPGGGPPEGPVAPVGGLTVITFHNSHLVYAITWYTLALMVAGAIWLGLRNERRADR